MSESQEPGIHTHGAAERSAVRRSTGVKAAAADAGRRRRRPRPETALLILGLLITVLAKLVAVRAYQPDSLLAAWLPTILTDIVFFGAIWVGFRAGRTVWGGAWFLRVCLVVGLVVLIWSVLNAAWLLLTGVQLQLGALLVILRSPREFWPTVRNHLVARPILTSFAALVGLSLGGYLLLRLWRPRGAGWERGRTLRGVSVVGLALGAVLLCRPLCPEPIGMGSLGQVVSYSSHVHALEVMLFGSGERDEDGADARVVPRAGGRLVTAPEPPEGGWPNVVVVLLESVSASGSGLSDGDAERMPNLANLAREGVLFENVRVPVPQTGKAFWTVLSGTRPDIWNDYTEAVLVDQPYEGLPTMLRRVGYTSAFFQMAKGTFECAPGTFANFGFDDAWFRENLEDPSANVGYLSGDDFRMLDPAFAWADAQAGPYCLMMITSVAHDPYVVPSWYGEPAEGKYARYLQTLRYTDDFLGELLLRLEVREALENTIVCVMGDHGDSFREDSRRIRWVPYEEVIGVPWVLHWPAGLRGGRRITWPCSQMDLTPTLLCLLGFDISSAAFEGMDALRPIPADRRLYFSAWFSGSPLGYVEGTDKYMYWPRDGQVLHYDLAADPQETSPRAVSGARAEEVRSAVRGWQRSSFLHFDAKRFRKRFLFDHWWAFSSGRYARAYYVSDAKR